MFGIWLCDFLAGYGGEGFVIGDDLGYLEWVGFVGCEHGCGFCRFGSEGLRMVNCRGEVMGE